MEPQRVTDIDNFLLDASTCTFTRQSEERILMESTESQGQVTVMLMLGAFPLSDPGRLILLRDPEGNEIGILDELGKLDPDSRRLVQEELEKTYFMPIIKEVNSIDHTLNLITWNVRTDRGHRVFEVRHARQNVRKIGRTRLIIKDVDGNRYEIPDWTRLPDYSKEWIYEFL